MVASSSASASQDAPVLAPKGKKKEEVEVNIPIITRGETSKSAVSEGAKVNKVVPGVIAHAASDDKDAGDKVISCTLI